MTNPIPTFSEDLSWVPSTIIKQHPGAKTCVACVAASIVKCSIEYVYDYLVVPFGEFIYDSEFGIFMLAHGFCCLPHLRLDEGTTGLTTNTQLNFTVDLENFPCFMSVETEFKGVEHAVFWTGKEVLDPSPLVDKKELSEYKVTTIIPIFKREWEKPRILRALEIGF